MAAVTDYHKLHGLKQQKFTLSQFWGPEAKVKLGRTKQGRAIIPLEVLALCHLLASFYLCLLSALSKTPTPLSHKRVHVNTFRARSDNS